jgi:hypothetical protein
MDWSRFGFRQGITTGHIDIVEFPQRLFIASLVVR